MRRTFLLIILIGMFAPTLGCGGLSQDDLKRNAIRRPKDDEETPAVAQKAPAKETKAETQAKQEETAPPDKAAEKKSPPAESEAPAPKSTPAKPAQEPEQVATADPPKAGTELPAETIPSQPDPVVATTTADDFPTTSSAETSTDSTPAKSGADRRKLTREEEEAEEARLAAIAIEERRKRSAERIARDRDVPSRGTTTTSASGKLADSASDLIENLFDRLVNPEKLIPEEFHRVAEELALRGASTEALAYYNAWAITTEKPAEWVEEAKWSSALRRPAAALHFGLGIEYSGAPQWLSKAQPIGSRNKTFSGLKRDKTNNDLKKYTGELGDRLLIGLDERNEEAALGSLFQPDPEMDKSKRKFDLKWQAQPTGFKPESLGPGITFLGGGKKKELLYIADLQNVDILVIFEMNLRQPRSGPMINITTIKLIDVRNGEELNSTRGLNNVRIAYDRQDRSNIDPVEKEFQELFAYVDESLELTPIPSSIKPEHAAGRVQELAAGEYSNPLPALAEMRLYFAKGLIDETRLLESYQALIGTENARLLARGTIPERVSVVAEYLPKIEPAKR